MMNELEQFGMSVEDGREVEMYGCTVADLREANSMTNWNDANSLSMLAMSILSDAQYVLAEGIQMRGVEADETARRYMNRAKYVLGLINSMTHPA